MDYLFAIANLKYIFDLVSSELFYKHSMKIIVTKYVFVALIEMHKFIFNADLSNLN
jgi:hypothetical protein